MKQREMRAELAFLVNVTESEADQDFSATRLKKALQHAYNLEVERAKLHGNRNHWVQASDDFTWAASSQTLTYPAFLRGKTIIDVYDITAGEPGFPLVAGDSGLQGCDFFWKDTNTWQWSTVGGPGSAKTLRAYYEAVAEDITLDEEVEPQLIPPQFHMLIVWTAAITWLRTPADERVPQDWKDERQELRLDFYKHVSKGRPLSNYPRIQNVDGDGVGILF